MCGDCARFVFCYRDDELRRLNGDHEACDRYLRMGYATEAVGSDVEHPSRYMHGNVECFDMLEATLSPREVIGFYKGCILKYIWREHDKGGLKDLQKAEMYARRLNEFCASIGERGTMELPGGAPHGASRESASDTD